MAGNDKKLEAKKDARHDIKNQLTSITLALEQLKFELKGENEDHTLYLEMIANSCKCINNLLNQL